MTDVENAEREVARTKLRFQESLQAAGETGTRLAIAVRRKATPAVLATLAVTVAVAVGLALLARNKPRARWRAPHRPTLGGSLARAAGGWLVRVAAERLALELSARLRVAPDPPLSVAG